jgi:hypothetical protein
MQTDHWPVVCLPAVVPGTWLEGETDLCTYQHFGSHASRHCECVLRSIEALKAYAAQGMPAPFKSGASVLASHMHLMSLDMHPAQLHDKCLHHLLKPNVS